MVKVATKDWRNLPQEKWNGTTIREYINHLNVEKFGIPAVSNNVRRENAMIAAMIKAEGIEVVKEFVEVCVTSYKGSEQYPTVNFGFMYSFMKAQYLPKILNKQLQKSKLQQIKEAQQARLEAQSQTLNDMEF
ncbi:hypothetical protein CON64_18625 [Bacillus pseudomycoides]|nr:hypothetical protein CON64_18625 [Bacillus pseudomycoides]